MGKNFANDDNLFHFAEKLVKKKGAGNEMDESFLKKELSKAGFDVLELSRLTTYIQTLTYPSHLSVELMHSQGETNRAIDQAKKLKNSQEKKRSIIFIVNGLVKKEEYEKAINLLNELEFSERCLCIKNLVIACIEHGFLKLLLKLTERMKDKRDQVEVYKNIIYALAKMDRFKQAIELLTLLESSNHFPEIQSNLVNLLVQHGHLSEAEGLAVAIEDRGDREDAYVVIIQNLIHANHKEEAISFVDTIPIDFDKVQAAKLMERMLALSHNEKEAREVREHFSLPYINYKRAA